MVDLKSSHFPVKEYCLNAIWFPYQVRPSYVQFFLNDGNNPKAIEIDLALAVNTCPLISLFRDKLPSHHEIEKLAIQQARNEIKIKLIYI